MLFESPFSQILLNIKSWETKIVRLICILLVIGFLCFDMVTGLEWEVSVSLSLTGSWFDVSFKYRNIWTKWIISVLFELTGDTDNRWLHSSSTYFFHIFSFFLRKLSCLQIFQNILYFCEKILCYLYYFFQSTGGSIWWGRSSMPLF